MHCVRLRRVIFPLPCDRASPSTSLLSPCEHLHRTSRTPETHQPSNSRAMAPRIKPGNPQWAEWLKEHADMLEEKGNKSCDSFRKVRPPPSSGVPTEPNRARPPAGGQVAHEEPTHVHASGGGPRARRRWAGDSQVHPQAHGSRVRAGRRRHASARSVGNATGPRETELTRCCPPPRVLITVVKERKQSAPKKPTKKKKGDLNSEDERKDDAAKEARRQRLTGKAGAAPVDEDVPPPPSKAKKTLERAKDKALDSDDPDGDPANEARRQRLTGKGPAQAPAILPAPRSDSVTDLLLVRIQAADKAEERAAAAAREAKRQRVGDVPVPRRVSNGSGPSSDAMASLMRNYVAPAKKADMYAPPPEVRRLAPDPESDHDAPVRPSPIWRPKGYAAKVSQAQAQALAPPQAASTSQLRRTQSAPGPAPAPANARAGPSGSKAAVRVPPAAALLHQSTSKPLPTSYDRYGGEHAISRHPLDPFPDPTLASIAFADFVPIRLEPGSFKVILIVDTREVAAKAKRTEITDKLEKENVRVDRKMLPLGDMIWVARPCYPDGTPTGGEDVVLDAVVERKRLDDLCGSIKDGRYTGQKVGSLPFPPCFLCLSFFSPTGSHEALGHLASHLPDRKVQHRGDLYV